jgi:uncharacterized protein YjiS (DUF1127 family)
MLDGLPLRADSSTLARKDDIPLTASLGRLRRWLRQSGRRLAAGRELHALNDRLLRDMGVERDEIDATVDDLLARDEAAADGRSGQAAD